MRGTSAPTTTTQRQPQSVAVTSLFILLDNPKPRFLVREQVNENRLTSRSPDRSFIDSALKIIDLSRFILPRLQNESNRTLNYPTPPPLNQVRSPVHLKDEYLARRIRSFCNYSIQLTVVSKIENLHPNPCLIVPSGTPTRVLPIRSNGFTVAFIVKILIFLI